MAITAPRLGTMCEVAGRRKCQPDHDRNGTIDNVRAGSASESSRRRKYRDHDCRARGAPLQSQPKHRSDKYLLPHSRRKGSLGLLLSLGSESAMCLDLPDGPGPVITMDCGTSVPWRYPPPAEINGRMTFCLPARVFERLSNHLDDTPSLPGPGDVSGEHLPPFRHPDRLNTRDFVCTALWVGFARTVDIGWVPDTNIMPGRDPTVRATGKSW